MTLVDPAVHQRRRPRPSAGFVARPGRGDARRRRAVPRRRGPGRVRPLRPAPVELRRLRRHPRLRHARQADGQRTPRRRAHHPPGDRRRASPPSTSTSAPSAATRSPPRGADRARHHRGRALVQRSATIGTLLRARISALGEDLGIELTVRGSGLIAGVELSPSTGIAVPRPCRGPTRPSGSPRQHRSARERAEGSTPAHLDRSSRRRLRRRPPQQPCRGRSASS